MAQNSLGRLEKVELRNYWSDEANEFTPWLALPENISLLGDELDMNIEVINQEERVGPFRADILAREVNSDKIVVIENQLESTDHKHLGQIITYAAGLNATTVIWISDEFEDEHRAALDWLNGLSEDVGFFGVVVELWRIGDSVPAPKFNLVSKPNNWKKQVHEKLENEPTSGQAFLLNFWTGFVEYVKKSNRKLRTRKPLMQNWMDFTMGMGGYYLNATVNTRERWISVSLFITGDERELHFTSLKDKYEEQSRREIDPKMSWELRRGKVASLARLTLDVNPNEVERWPEQFKLLVDTLEKFQAFFGPKIREIQ